MKQRQYITALTMIVALTGLSPVVAADAGGTSDGEQVQPDQRQFERPLAYKLSPQQLDAVHAGFIPAAVIAKRVIVFVASKVIVAGIDAVTEPGDPAPPQPVERPCIQCSIQ